MYHDVEVMRWFWFTLNQTLQILHIAQKEKCHNFKGNVEYLQSEEICCKLL